MAFIYNLLDTWNNAGTVFSGIKLNVTNTASATGSKLLDLQIGGSSYFNVDKSGQIAFLAGTAAAPIIIPSGDLNTGMWFPAADTVAWSTNGSERMRITSSGNVGIGTSSPAALLHLAVSAAPTGTTQTFSRLTAGNTYGADFGGGLIQGVGSIATLSTVNNGVATERIRIVDPSGNVGIGTTAPDARLSVNGIASFGAGAAATPSVTAFGDLDTGMWFPAADTIAWSTGGVERLRIASGGTVSTAGTLSVAAAGTLSANQISWASSTAFQPQIFLTNNAADATSAIWTTLKSRGGITPANSGDNIGVFAFNSYSTNGTSWSAVQISVQSEGASVTRHAGNIRFITTNTSDVFGERMRITSAGNVGIGTTAPDALLSVNGIASFGAGAVATPSITAFGDLDTGMWFPAANTLAWSTGGVERLRVASSGNVGIGTSSFGTSAATVFSIATGTAPTTGPADTIQIYSTDLSAGNTMLSLYTEGTVVNANTTTAATHRIAIRVNGTVYYLLANTAA